MCKLFLQEYVVYFRKNGAAQGNKTHCLGVQAVFR